MGGNFVRHTAVRVAAATALAGLSSGTAAGFELGNHPVRAELVASRAPVRAGEPFELGVKLEIDDGWHTYWRYAGAAGAPSHVDWRLPPGLEAGELRWEAPQKYDEQGLVVYGYADETMLSAEVTGVPEAADSLAIAAEVSWLVCREVCIPGDTLLTLGLPLAGAAAPANEELFEKHRRRMPRPWAGPEEPVRLRHRVSGAPEGGETVSLTIIPRGEDVAVDGATPDFYPIEGESFLLDPPTRRVDSAASQVHLELNLYFEGEEKPAELTGVVVYERPGDPGPSYRTVSLDLDAGRRPGLSAMEFTGAEPARGSLPAYLLFALVGGLILNLMPCVFPVISLKVLGFVSQAGESRARARQLGLAFSAGVVAAFLGLAGAVLLVKSGGEQIGWGFQFQSPAFVIFLCALVFLLSLSLFGLITVRIAVGQGNLGGLADGEGLAGSFFNGVLATILATPCTAPFLGTALGFAFSQSAGVTVGIFLVTGLGMALPYVLLAAEPGWLRFLPRPGPWMERFKQLMGFLLAATALWLLWVLGKQLGVEAVIWTAAFLLALAMAAWIPGQWIDLRSSPRQRAVAWTAAAAITAAAYGGFLHPLMAAERQLSEAPAGESSGWLAFSQDEIERQVAAGRHVFIDFTAEWCWTCKVNKRAVLDTEEVGDRFSRHDVVLVRADWTNRNPEITGLLRAFGRSGVPLYVIFPGGRIDAPLVLPEVITPGILFEALEEAESRRASTPGPGGNRGETGS